MSKENIKKTDYGYELIWANKENYCGKILVFEAKGSKTPFHFQSKTEKSFFCNSGKFMLRYIETSSGTAYQSELVEGTAYHVPKNQPISLEALENNSSVTEVSSLYDPNDIYIVSKLGN